MEKVPLYYVVKGFFKGSPLTLQEVEMPGHSGRAYITLEEAKKLMFRCYQEGDRSVGIIRVVATCKDVKVEYKLDVTEEEKI